MGAHPLDDAEDVIAAAATAVPMTAAHVLVAKRHEALIARRGRPVAIADMASLDREIADAAVELQACRHARAEQIAIKLRGVQVSAANAARTAVAELQRAARIFDKCAATVAEAAHQPAPPPLLSVLDGFNFDAASRGRGASG